MDVKEEGVGAFDPIWEWLQSPSRGETQDLSYCPVSGNREGEIRLVPIGTLCLVPAPPSFSL